jgi:replicative DNA helicase
MAAEPLDDEIARRAARFEQRTNKPRPTDESVQIGEVEDETQNDQRRYKLGLENIDVSMGRLRPGEFTVIGALTGYGKTSLLEQIGRSNALDYKVFFATLEMTEAEIQSNMIAREMGLDLDDFERERASRTDKYAEALARTRALNLRLWRPPLGRAPNIQAIFKRAEQTSSDMLMIDYAALLEGWIPGNEAAKMVRYIQGQAKATGIHVVLLAQLQFEALSSAIRWQESIIRYRRGDDHCEES